MQYREFGHHGEFALDRPLWRHGEFRRVRSGNHPVAFSTAAAWAWTAYDLHQKTGNLLIADGSVQSTTIIGLHTFMQNATNSIEGPCWNFLP